MNHRQAQVQVARLISSLYLITVDCRVQACPGSAVKWSDYILVSKIEFLLIYQKRIEFLFIHWLIENRKFSHI